MFDRYTPPTRFSHLIQHSDSGGYYVPVAFPEVLLASPPLGGLIGSAVVLLAECALLATALTLPLDTDPFSDEVDAATAGLADLAVLWHSYGIESLSCLLLFNDAERSIASGYPLRFW